MAKAQTGRCAYVFFVILVVMKFNYYGSSPASLPGFDIGINVLEFENFYSLYIYTQKYESCSANLGTIPNLQARVTK